MVRTSSQREAHGASRFSFQVGYNAAMTEKETASTVVNPETALLLDYLKNHDALCPLCKYNLRGLTVARCPECGREIRLTVGMTEPYLRAYIVFLVALILPAGLGLLVWIMMMREGLTIYSSSPRGPLSTMILIGFQASLLPATVAVVGRRRFMRLSTGVQWRLATLGMAEALALFGGWFFVLTH
jgi:hypothetical protein